MKWIAERVLDYRDDAGQHHPLFVRVSQPIEDGTCWACAYELGAPVSFAATAYGEDSLQALAMALRAIDAHLNTPALRNRVRWLGLSPEDEACLVSR